MKGENWPSSDARQWSTRYGNTERGKGHQGDRAPGVGSMVKSDPDRGPREAAGVEGDGLLASGASLDS